MLSVACMTALAASRLLLLLHRVFLCTLHSSTHPGCAAHLQLVLQPLQLLLTDATAKLDKPPPHTCQPIGLILLLRNTAISSQAAAQDWLWMHRLFEPGRGDPEAR